MPNKCSDDELPWNRIADNALDTKYPYGNVCSVEYINCKTFSKLNN